MIKENRSIAPKVRKGEVMPEQQPGKTVTRYHGELVFVSMATENDIFVGRSNYTERQLKELLAMQVKPKQKRLRFSGGSW